MTFKATSVALEAEGFFAFNYASRWEITLLKHCFLRSVSHFLLQRLTSDKSWMTILGM